MDPILLFSINLQSSVTFSNSYSIYLTTLKRNKEQCNSQVLQMWQALKRIFINRVKSVGCKQAVTQISILVSHIYL